MTCWRGAIRLGGGGGGQRRETGRRERIDGGRLDYDLSKQRSDATTTGTNETWQLLNMKRTPPSTGGRAGRRAAIGRERAAHQSLSASAAG